MMEVKDNAEVVQKAHIEKIQVKLYLMMRKVLIQVSVRFVELDKSLKLIEVVVILVVKALPVQPQKKLVQIVELDKSPMKIAVSVSHVVMVNTVQQKILVVNIVKLEKVQMKPRVDVQIVELVLTEQQQRILIASNVE